MILEIATITLNPGQADEFIRVMPDAFPVIASATGYIRHELHRGIERPDVFTLFVWWESVEAHEVNFRQTELFGRWRGVWGHLMQSSHVEHFAQVD